MEISHKVVSRSENVLEILSHRVRCGCDAVPHRLQGFPGVASELPCQSCGFHQSLVVVIEPLECHTNTDNASECSKIWIHNQADCGLTERLQLVCQSIHILRQFDDVANLGIIDNIHTKELRPLQVICCLHHRVVVIANVAIISLRLLLSQLQLVSYLVYMLG